jgi:glutamate--cysteine ligase
MEYKIQTKEALESFVCGHWDTVNTYIETLKKDLPIPFYSSVDVRESKTKYAPVDHNMYPAGFNNLCTSDYKDASIVANETIKKLKPNAKWIGIFPESNTKNLMYLDHLITLSKLIEDTGRNVRLLSFDPNLFSEDMECLGLISANGSPVTICKASINDGEIFVNGQKMDLIICNNDQSNPWPIDWSIVKTTINPTPKIGWFRRQKNIHFAYYKKVADEFCTHFDINPDLIQARFAAVEDVDFENKNGLEKLGSAVDGIINELKPGSKVFVKASQGTYGMGISVVSSGEEIINMNRKTRNKMDIGKNSIKFTSLLVQEGVETIIK